MSDTRKPRAPRRPYIAGNWKMHLTLDEAVRLADELKRRVGRIRSVDMAVVPSFPFIASVAERLRGERIAVGAQDIHPAPSGAYTGGVSGPPLRSAGATFVLVGHSERRHVFGESDGLCAEKVHAGLDHGLDVVLCVGEKLTERQSQMTFEVVERQLRTGLEGVGAAAMAHVTIAYEPVWAIGTGLTATPAQAQEVHRFIREWLGDRYDAALAAATRIQYGGSVKPDNVAGLLDGPDVDGGLVGGASLDAGGFAAIITAAAETVSRGDF